MCIIHRRCMFRGKWHFFENINDFRGSAVYIYNYEVFISALTANVYTLQAITKRSLMLQSYFMSFQNN